MTGLFCGCSDVPRDSRAFYRTATAVEYRVGLFSPPKARVLKAWAEEAQKAASPMRSIWVAWQAFTHRAADIRKGHGLKLQEGENAANLGHFRATAENRRVWDKIKEQAQNVGASHILLETPASFSPASANKLALTAFVKEWALLPENMKLVWHPAGFWSREESIALAESLGMILAIDPLVDDKEELPKGESVYLQMLGRRGLMDSYSDDDLERILNIAARYDDVTIIFRTHDSLGDATRLLKLSETYEPDDDFEFDDEEDDFADDSDEAFDDDEDELEDDDESSFDEE